MEDPLSVLIHETVGLSDFMPTSIIANNNLFTTTKSSSYQVIVGVIHSLHQHRTQAWHQLPLKKARPRGDREES